MIFVDEAHKLKNPASKITLAFNQFACKVRFGLTGTAIQNAYEEMWTLLDWSNTGRLGSLKEWKTAVSKPLAVGQSASASDGERAIAKVVESPRYYDEITHDFPIRPSRVFLSLNYFRNSSCVGAQRPSIRLCHHLSVTFAL